MARKLSWKDLTGITKSKRRIKKSTGCLIGIAVFIGLGLIAYSILG